MALFVSSITAAGVFINPGLLINGVVTLFGNFFYAAFIFDKISSYQIHLDTEITFRLHDKEITTRYIIVVVAISVTVVAINFIEANIANKARNAAKNKRKRENKKATKAIKAAESL